MDTCATASRVAMLAAGFVVAKGRPTGAKVETTIAFIPKAWSAPHFARHDLLGAKWLAKWRRLTAQFPT